MRRYPEYKESGLERIGEIPAHWEMINTKYLFRLVTEPAPKNNDYELLSIYTNIGVKPRRELEERGNRATTTDGYWLVKKGDFIVNKLLAWMGAIGLSNYEGVTSPAYDILRKIRPLNERFYEYLFRCGLYFIEFKKRSRGIMEVRLRLYFDQFGQIPLVFPTVHEQTQIANFLDRKTGQIDELLRIKERKIELLQEQRTVLINQVVTKGLDPNVEMKPSGVEWIGEIPAHWEIRKIKHIATFVSQKSTPETDAIKISPENVESETGKVLDFYSPYNSVGVKFQAGDVLFNKLRVYLSKVVFTEYSGYSLGEMIVIRPSLQDTGKHLFYLMLSCRFIEYCDSISYGVKMPRTAIDDILNAQIPLTSYQEQIQIANFLDRKTEQIDELISSEQQSIELLKEYRQSLISEVVTGKIDVRDAVAQNNP